MISRLSTGVRLAVPARGRFPLAIRGSGPTSPIPQGIPTTFIEAPLSQAAVQAQLAAGRPVEVCYQWSGSASTHVALIVGENAAGDFEVYDPTYGPGSRSFSQIASAYGLGAWIYSFTF